MKRSIFYLDDEETLLSTFREMFEKDYEVHTAATLADARRILKDFAPDIVISDQMMPEIEGTMFLREAAQLCPASYRILLTGKATVIEVIGEITSGVVQLFVTKPWDEARMREALERAGLEIERQRKDSG